MSTPAAQLTIIAGAIVDALQSGPIPESQLLNTVTRQLGLAVMGFMSALRLLEQDHAIAATRAHPGAERVWSIPLVVSPDRSDRSDRSVQ